MKEEGSECVWCDCAQQQQQYDNNNRAGQGNTVVRTSAAAKIISPSASSAKLDGSCSCFSLRASLCRRNRLDFAALISYSNLTLYLLDIHSVVHLLATKQTQAWPVSRCVFVALFSDERLHAYCLLHFESIDARRSVCIHSLGGDRLHMSRGSCRELLITYSSPFRIASSTCIYAFVVVPQT